MTAVEGHSSVVAEMEDDLFDLKAVRQDIARARRRALQLGAAVCHVERLDDDHLLICETAEQLKVAAAGGRR